MKAGFTSGGFLVSTGDSLALDAEVQADWGFNTFSLIEAAGQSCARALSGAFPFLMKNRPRVTVCAGSGNNGADAMVMLRYWILAGLVDASSSALVINSLPKNDDRSPRAELFKSLGKMKVPVLVWDSDTGKASGLSPDAVFSQSDIIVDGIAGTGVTGALRGAALEMVQAVNAHRQNPYLPLPSEAAACQNSQKQPFVVSVDVPSGNSDFWEPGMAVIKADLTLAIEPQKYCVYTPAARPLAGVILPVGGIFPREVTLRYRGAELLNWKSARKRIPGIRPDAYKNERGTVEIRAGSPGATGAALIAARGAQAAGAGLIRLVADDDIYPILASRAGGIMVIPAEKQDGAGLGERFKPDAVLLGPGWGITPERAPVLEKALDKEKTGTPLILDADAIELARDKVFNGNAILTPHPGEFSRYTGIPAERLLCRPVPVLSDYARERKAVIIFKGHVITIAAPDGRLAVVDGMMPGLAAGGSGDLLAGFCAAIAARTIRDSRGFDPYNCACAAAALLVACGASKGFNSRFTDPLELAGRAAELAGKAWLGQNGRRGGFRHE